jgi:hypothetical protein
LAYTYPHAILLYGFCRRQLNTKLGTAAPIVIGCQPQPGTAAAAQCHDFKSNSANSWDVWLRIPALRAMLASSENRN